MKGVASAAFLAVVFLVHGSPSGAVPATKTAEATDSAETSFLTQKKNDFVKSVKSVIGSIQGRFSPRPEDLAEKHRQRRGLLVQCCGFYRCVNGNKKATVQCKQAPAPAAGGSLNLGGITLPAIDITTPDLLGAIDGALGGVTVPAVTIPAVTIPSLSLGGGSLGTPVTIITVLGTSCPLGYVPANSTTLAAPAAGGSLLGGVLG